MFPFVAILVVGLVAPWFWHLYKVSGNPLGSNLPYLLFGAAGYEGDQIFRSASIPGYEALFKAASTKEYSGFLWHFEHGWDLLGSNPMVLFFGASVLHQFKRRLQILGGVKQLIFAR